MKLKYLGSEGITLKYIGGVEPDAVITVDESDPKALAIAEALIEAGLFEEAEE